MAMNLGGGSDERGPVAEINVTPMVDVMLVLLVIFMVTTPFMENGIPIQLPKAKTKSIERGENPVTLSLTKESRIYLNKEEVYMNNLAGRLQILYKGRARKEIFIRADGALPYSMVAQTMATVKNAGIDKIGLVTVPPDAPQKTTRKK